MKIVEHRLLRGPNIHSPRPALMAILDLEDLDDVSSASVPGFTDRLLALIPSLDEHRCSLGRRGGFVERLREGTYMAHIVEHVLIELQCLTGPEVGFGKARRVVGRPRHYSIVCSFRIEPLVVAALPLALELVDCLAHGRPVAGFDERLRRLRAIARRSELGPSTLAIVQAAERRNIPVLRLSDDSSLFQLGWGARSKRVRATITGRTSHVAVDIAGDKALTKQLLAEAGLPVPRGGVATDADEGVALAQRLGGLLTVKPLDANQGKGVQVRLRGADEIRSAFGFAAQWSRRVIVEAFVEGDDYRVLVVGERVVAASRRRPPTVVGDGVRSVLELIEAENLRPERGDGHGKALSRIRIDAPALETLAAQGLSPDSVPQAGRRVVLRGNANLSTGGTAEDVTDRMHPETAQACVRAARTIGLDVAGIDLVCADIAHPLHAQRGAIIEINAAPGIRMHEHPSEGIARRAGAAIVDSLFPEGDDGRIPTIAITGTNGKTTTTRAIANVLQAAGYRTGVTTTGGVYVGQEQLSAGDCTGYWSARTLLTAPDVEAAVLETARGGIIKRGLGFDRCDVGVVLNVEADHLGQDGIDTIEDLARVKGLIARSARKAVVLNAADRHCVAMARDVQEGVEVVWFTMGQGMRIVERHLAGGGRAVLLQGSAIVLCDGDRRIPLVDANRLPFTLSGLARFNVENALACAAAAWAAGIERAAICEGLARFNLSSDGNPLRLNLFRVGDRLVIVDFAHNPAAYQAALGTAQALPHRRLVALAAAPGDRRDRELADIGRICATGCDELVVYEMNDRRGRERGATAARIADAALAAGIGNERLHVVPDVREAVAKALSLCGPGDVLFYGCASYLEDLTDVAPDAEELVVVERRRAHLAPYADGLSVDRPTQTAKTGSWDPSMPDRRAPSPRPYMVPAARLAQAAA